MTDIPTNPSSAPMSDEQPDELDGVRTIAQVFDDFEHSGPPYANLQAKWQYEAIREYLEPQLVAALAQHTKEAVARAKAEARKAAFDKIFEMAPKGNFEHWTKQMTANWFVALGRLERELSAPQQSTSPDGDADNELQICECGDYRRDHENGTGACRMPDDLTHGFKPCREFRPTELAAPAVHKTDIEGGGEK